MQKSTCNPKVILFCSAVSFVGPKIDWCRVKLRTLLVNWPLGLSSNVECSTVFDLSISLIGNTLKICVSDVVNNLNAGLSFFLSIESRFYRACSDKCVTKLTLCLILSDIGIKFFSTTWTESNPFRTHSRPTSDNLYACGRKVTLPAAPI